MVDAVRGTGGRQQQAAPPDVQGLLVCNGKRRPPFALAAPVVVHPPGVVRNAGRPGAAHEIVDQRWTGHRRRREGRHDASVDHGQVEGNHCSEEHTENPAAAREQSVEADHREQRHHQEGHEQGLDRVAEGTRQG